MQRHAAILKPKFDAVQEVLGRELSGKGVAEWTRPAGGYFASVDTWDGCARRVIQLAAEAGVKLTPAGSTYPYKRDPRDRNIRIAPSFPPLADIRDLSKLLTDPDPYASERMLDRLLAVRGFRERVGGECSILGWVEGPAAEAADLRGVQDFLMDLMDDEQASSDLMARCTQTAIRFAEAQLNEGADTIGIGDAIASQLPPDLYRRLVWPLEKRLVAAIHAKNGLVKLHICGNITHLLPHIGELGVDMPITRTVCQMLFDGLPAAQAVDALLNRGIKAEF